MYVLPWHIAEYKSTGRLPILFMVSWTGGKILVPRSRLKIWFRETGLAVPSRVSLLILYILTLNLVPPNVRSGVHIYLPPYTIGSVTTLSGHAIAYRWRSLPRVRCVRTQTLLCTAAIHTVYFVCFLPIHSGHQVRWTYQPGSHRRKVTQDFSSAFLLRCVPSFFSREGFSHSFPSSTVKSNFCVSTIWSLSTRWVFYYFFLVRKIPFTGIELTSQRVIRGWLWATGATGRTIIKQSSNNILLRTQNSCKKQLLLVTKYVR